jgi:hypothetical protein
MEYKYLTALLANENNINIVDKDDIYPPNSRCPISTTTLS